MTSLDALDARLIPLLHGGVVLIRNGPAAELQLQIRDADTPAVRLGSLRLGAGQILLDQIPQQDLTLDVLCDGKPIAGSPLQVQIGDWSGSVDWVAGRLVAGRARNLRKLAEDVVVVACNSAGQTGFATARAAEGGRFLMVLPEALLSPSQSPSHSITLGIAGSNYVLKNGQLAAQAGLGQGGAQLQRQPRPATLPLAIRIKISTPNLKEAPQWGDYHFANSLSASFERLGYQAAVDTNDVWYAQAKQEDVVVTLRGRHRLRVDPGKINIMWLISHPDRIPDDEYADFDHIAVASDIYAAELRARGLTQVSVLHQATDAGLFREDATIARKPS